MLGVAGSEMANVITEASAIKEGGLERTLPR